MINLFKELNKKMNGLIWSFFSTGIFLLILAVLIVATDYTLRIIMGLITLLVSYAFLFGAYKISILKNEIKKHFKL